MIIRDGHTIAKFDFPNLKAGQEVWCISNRMWMKIDKIVHGKIHVTDKYSRALIYDYEGCRGYSHPELVAVKRLVEIDDVPTKKFVFGEENWEVFYNHEDKEYVMHEHHYLETVNANVYTEDNARIIMNMMEARYNEKS